MTPHRGNLWQTVNTNRILNSRDAFLLAGSGEVDRFASGRSLVAAPLPSPFVLELMTKQSHRPPVRAWQPGTYRSCVN